MRINVIGDSHVVLFNGGNSFNPMERPDPTDTLKHFRTYHLAPIQAYMIGVSEENTFKDEVFKILETLDKKDPLLFVMGEIDCRTYILKKHIKGMLSLEEAVAQHIQLYLKGIGDILDKGFSITLWSPTPIREYSDSPIFCYSHIEDCQRSTMEFNKQLIISSFSWDRLTAGFLRSPQNLHGAAIFESGRARLWPKTV